MSKPTDNEFTWLTSQTEYREVRRSKHGDELRWLVNCETMISSFC